MDGGTLGRAELGGFDADSALAAADALQGLSGHRYQAAWQAAGVEQALPLFPLPAGDRNGMKDLGYIRGRHGPRIAPDGIG